MERKMEGETDEHKRRDWASKMETMSDQDQVEEEEK